MRLFWMTLGALALAGCEAKPSTGSAAVHGRYAGIGVYSAGTLWSKMVTSPPNSASAATTADDEHVIVVVDSQTGEIRQCGDYTGVCVSLNPWTRAIAPSQNTPVTLTKHLADAAEAQQETAPPKDKK